MRIRRALAWVALWTSLALLFGLLIYFVNPSFVHGIDGKDKALTFYSGYIIELSLSVDNLFVFLVIFSSFNIPTRHQRRALNYGIIGAVVLRLLFILLGVALVSRFQWVLYIFGCLLLLSGVSVLLGKEKEKDYTKTGVARHIDKVIPYTGTLEGEKFFVRRDGKLYATLLFLVLLVIEVADLIFNIDSIPAIFSFTQDTFIIFTANVFAILGLRSLYFVLEKLNQMFRYVKYGVAIILIFTGFKLIAHNLVAYGLFENSVFIQNLVSALDDKVISICIIVILLLLSIFASMILNGSKKQQDHNN